MTIPRRQHWSFLALVLLAILLHGYENWRGEKLAITWGWFLWSLLPYGGFCVALLWNRVSGVTATAGAAAALAVDLYIHHSVFVAPKGSTAALALIFVPLWNTLLFGPLAMLLTAFIVKRWRKNANPL